MPLTFTTAFTSPVNPPGATPVLSHAQVWKAFLLKAEHPQRFVPAIEQCEIVERRESGLTRRVTFAASMGAGMMSGAQLEDVEFVGDMRADFLMRATGTRIQNIISRGAGEHELYITYTFAFVYPELEEGSPEAHARVAQMTGMGAKVVPGGVAEMRELAQKGEI